MVTAELIWLKSLLKERGVAYEPQFIDLCNNLSTQHLAKNLVMHTQTKHIKVDLHFAREQVAQQLIYVPYVPSKGQVADALTTCLPSSRFIFLKYKLLVLPRPKFERGGGGGG